MSSGWLYGPLYHIGDCADWITTSVKAVHGLPICEKCKTGNRQGALDSPGRCVTDPEQRPISMSFPYFESAGYENEA